MRDAGLRMIFMGAENASATTLKFMSKGPLLPETTLAMAEKSARYNIIPEFSFVLGNPPGGFSELDRRIERALRDAAGPEGFTYDYCKLYAVARRP